MKNINTPNMNGKCEMNENQCFVMFVVKIEMNEIEWKEQIMQNMYLSTNNAKHQCFTMNTVKTNVLKYEMNETKKKKEWLTAIIIGVPIQ